MDNKSIFARNLQKQLDLNGKSRRDVCNALGLSYYTFSDWVNGKKYPRMDKVEMLADYFGILKSDLIEDKTEEEKEKPSETEGLSESHIKLIEIAKTLSVEDATMLLAALQAKQKQ